MPRIMVGQTSTNIWFSTICQIHNLLSGSLKELILWMITMVCMFLRVSTRICHGQCPAPPEIPKCLIHSRVDIGFRRG